MYRVGFNWYHLRQMFWDSKVYEFSGKHYLVKITEHVGIQIHTREYLSICGVCIYGKRVFKTIHRDSWLRPFAQHWRSIARERARVRRECAARLIQEWVVRWLYSPRVPGPMFLKLKNKLESNF